MSFTCGYHNGLGLSLTLRNTLAFGRTIIRLKTLEGDLSAAHENAKADVPTVLAIVARVANVNTSSLSVNQRLFGDLNMDSVDLVQLIVAIEDALSVEFEVEDLVDERLETVGDLLAMVDQTRFYSQGCCRSQMSNRHDTDISV